MWQYELRFIFFFQAEDGIRDLVRSRGLGDVYKRQALASAMAAAPARPSAAPMGTPINIMAKKATNSRVCLLYKSDAADERSSVDLGGRRILKKKKKHATRLRSNHMKKRHIHSHSRLKQ